MKTCIRIIAALALIVGCAHTAQAQALINNTTLSAAITRTDASVITLAAVTCTGCTFGPDTVVFVAGSGSREAMVVTGQYAAGGGSLTIPVRRGQLGTVASVHLSGAVVYVGPQNRFHLATVGTPGSGDPQGPCGARSSQPFLPWINVLSGNIWNCDGSGNWVGINSAKLVYNSNGPLSGQ